MVSVLDFGANGPGSGPGPVHCVVFLGKTLKFYVLIHLYLVEFFNFLIKY